MVEKARRQRVDTDADDDEWTVFAREEEGAQARHVGRVVAPNADAAHEQAAQLFAWYDEEVWVCPASELRRYVASEDADLPADGTESRTHEL